MKYRSFQGAKIKLLTNSCVFSTLNCSTKNVMGITQVYSAAENFTESVRFIEFFKKPCLEKLSYLVKFILVVLIKIFQQSVELNQYCAKIRKEPTTSLNFIILFDSFGDLLTRNPYNVFKTCPESLKLASAESAREKHSRYVLHRVLWANWIKHSASSSKWDTLLCSGKILY